jgi:hypothetical protein
MPRRTWRFNLQDGEHSVTLAHGQWSGTRKIWVDGKQVENSRRMLDIGSRHRFSVGGETAEIVIIKGILRDAYYLLIKDSPLPSETDVAAGIDAEQLSQSRAFQATKYWREVASRTGLKYLPVADTDWGLRQRLYGFIKGYLIVVRLGRRSNDYRSVVVLLAHHAPVNNPDASVEQMRADPQVKEFMGFKRKVPDNVWLGDENYTLITWPHQPKQESADALAARIGAVVNMIARYAKPLPPQLCTQCRTRAAGQIALINGFPVQLCDVCQKDIVKSRRALQHDYERSPSHLGRGTLAGLGAALIAGLGWAFIVVLFDVIAAVLAVLIFVAVLKAMEATGTKRTRRSVLIASGLALLGVFIGSYVTLTWQFFREASMPVSLQTFADVFVETLQSRLLRVSLAFSAVGIIPFAWLAWRDQDRYLAYMLRPAIEVLEG